MFFVFFAFWLLLNGSWTTEIAVVGLVLSTALYLFVWKFMGYSPRLEWKLLRRVPRAVCYLVYLVKEIILSACRVIRLVWSPRLEVQPRLISFRTRLKTHAGKAILADSITLTPGTITASVREDVLMVHCLDEDFAQDMEGGEMEMRIVKLEGGKRHE